MSAAAATNRVRPTAYSLLPQYSGVSTNANIPIARMETWRREAIQKAIRFGGLAQNWDGRGSSAPGIGVRQTAIEFLSSVPAVSAPRMVPVSGGGFHFEWSAGDRELEISLEPDSRIEVLRVERGMPIEDDPSMSLSALFGWLTSR